MVDVDKLSDAELRTKLIEFGFPVMPITGTTRKVMAKKLKMLIENENKINSPGGRRSLGRYSSEEESDTDVKTSKKKENRRATMAAPVMQPPSTNVKLRKSIRLNDSPEKEVVSPREVRTTTTTTTTRTQKILKASQDEFDTGSESESDIVSNSYRSSNIGLGGSSSSYESSPIKTNYSPIKSSLLNSYATSNIDSAGDRYSPSRVDSSYGTGKSTSFSANTSNTRFSSYNSPSLASEYAADRLNQMRSRLSLGSPSYEKPSYTSTNAIEKEETPFLSNFTKRLSALSGDKKTDEYKNDIIKEHDTNGASSYVRSSLSSFRAGKGRETIYDYRSNQKNIIKNNFVSFAVLASAALFFVFLAIMYLGMKSDTSVTPIGSNIPLCVRNDSKSKKGVNCIPEDDVRDAMNLLNAIKPELHKRSVANKCFDTKLKAHMTESEIISFCMTNFALKDEYKIRGDLRNMEILSLNNPQWGISIVQKEDNNGVVIEEDIVKSMENILFNENKITSLVIFRPDVPWSCKFYNTCFFAFNSVLFIVLAFALFYFLNIGLKYYKRHEQRKKEEIGFMIEKIIEILQSTVHEEGGENYVVINHVRDMILPVTERKKKEKSWAEAVKFINENESRVRTEVQVVQGEPFEVWRWIGAANLSTGGDRSDYVYRQGRRIVDVQYLIKEVLKFPHKRLRFCSSTDVDIKHEIRDDFLSVILLHCSKCNVDYPVCSEEPEMELMNVNLAFVAGIVSLGLSLHQLNELCSSLQIPAISGKSYRNYLDRIYDIYNESLEESKDTTNSFDKRIIESSTPVLKVDDYETKRRNFLQSLELAPEQIEELSLLTVAQKDNPLWFQERKKRLTASNFGRICKLLPSTDKTKVAKDIFFSKFTGNIYTQYGNDNEMNAIKDFEKLLGKTVTSCGLFVHCLHQFLAASPDGLIDDDAIIEIKCPYKAKDLTPQNAIEQKLIQFATLQDGMLRLKQTDKYYCQVQGQLFVTGRKFCYFVIWTPHGLLYEMIEKDEECWNEMFPKLKAFYFENLLPVILKQM